MVQTYKIGTTANSTSTMHKLSTTPITMECFDTDDMNLNLKVYNFIDFPGGLPIEPAITAFIDILEGLRQAYLKTKDKKYWKELIRLLPESWLQTRTVTMNYENLRSMYFQRRNHKLNEWSGKDNPDKENFIKWVKSLPYAEELIMYERKETDGEKK